jgi:hypothetical protein
MSTLIPFSANNNASPPFSNSVTLDGTSYTLSAFWNISGQRWYASLTDQSGNGGFDRFAAELRHPVGTGHLLYVYAFIPGRHRKL